MLVQYDALETGQKEIDDWLNECAEFLSTLRTGKSQAELHADGEYLKASDKDLFTIKRTITTYDANKTSPYIFFATFPVKLTCLKP